MNIRKAQVGDAEEIMNLVVGLSYFYLGDESAIMPSWFATTLELTEFEQRLSNKAFSHIVYCDNDAIVGYIAIKSQSHIYHYLLLKTTKVEVLLSSCGIM